ncbi:MAG: toll/interleukin-1 receptor domain-containing protein [Candidatus Hodarchaeota archaeon]
MVKVFFSYATVDEEKFNIPELAELLETKPNIEKVFYWGRDSTGSIIKYMEDSITAANTCIFFYSPDASKSKPVEQERDMAVYLGKHIIPLFNNIDEVPLSLRTKTGINLSGKTSETIAEEIFRLINQQFGIVLEEEAVSFVILSKNGLPLFHEDFKPDFTVDPDFLAGFLVAIRSFAKETFIQNEILGGLIFKDHALLMKEKEDIVLIYLFKGQWYFADQKLTRCVESLCKNKPNWQNLQAAAETGNIKLIESSAIKDVVSNIFLPKN